VADHIPGLADTLRCHLGPSDVVVSTWRLDGHPDHDATGEATAQACGEVGCRFIEAPVWMWHWSAPADPRVPWSRLRGLRATGDALERKRHALSAHGTKLAPRAGMGGPVLGAPILDRSIRPVECDFEPLSP
jgi:LmbE family N-acetylglucosaminyl deacetylase